MSSKLLVSIEFYIKACYSGYHLRATNRSSSLKVKLEFGGRQSKEAVNIFFVNSDWISNNFTKKK